MKAGPNGIDVPGWADTEEGKEMGSKRRLRPGVVSVVLRDPRHSCTAGRLEKDVSVHEKRGNRTNNALVRCFLLVPGTLPRITLSVCALLL